MGNYKRVVLNETDSVSDSYASNDVQQQLGKFDNSYTSKKLNDLYNEFDSITFNDDLNSATIVKNNVVESQKVSDKFKVTVYLTTAIIVTLMLAFLAIYNIFVINNLNSNIQLLQEEVAVSQTELNTIYSNSANYTEEELKQLIQTSLEGNYGNIALNGAASVEMLETNNVNNYSSYESTNWFDKFCTFLSKVFEV